MFKGQAEAVAEAGEAEEKEDIYGKTTEQA